MFLGAWEANQVLLKSLRMGWPPPWEIADGTTRTQEIVSSRFGCSTSCKLLCWRCWRWTFQCFPTYFIIFPYHYLSRVKRSKPWSKATSFAKRFNATAAAFAGPLALHTESFAATKDIQGLTDNRKQENTGKATSQRATLVATNM